MPRAAGATGGLPDDQLALHERVDRQWLAYVPAAGAWMVVDAPESTFPESKLCPSSAVTVCVALSSFATLMEAPCWTRRVSGENLKLLMVIADGVPAEPAALGAAPALGPPSSPPQPVASRAATAAIESRVYARNLMCTDVRAALVRADTHRRIRDRAA
jgi:hypothetical protein